MNVDTAAREAPRIGFRISRDELRYLAMVAALAGATILASRVSFVAFVVLGSVVLGALAYAAWRWPRAVLVAVVLAPLVDRYLIGLLLPASLELWARLISESVLAVSAVIISVRSLRAGTFVAAFRHPVAAGLAFFLAVSVASAVVNGVEPGVAVVGMLFTVDAMALFVLARMVRFTPRQMLAVATLFAAFVVVTAAIGIAQAVLAPDILGLPVLRGRFGESVRVASFVGDPGLFATMLCMAVGIPLFAFAQLRGGRLRTVALVSAYLLLVALVLSFSRGGWLGFVAGFGITAVVLDRRAFVLAVAVSVVAFATAWFMPRNLIVGSESASAGSVETSDILESTADRSAALYEGRDLRLLFVVNAVPIIRDHPVLGVGPGRFGGAAARTFDSPVYRAYGTDRLFWNPRQQTVDDFWLHLVVEVGALGTLAYLTTLGAATLPLFRAALRARPAEAALLAAIITMVGAMSANGVTSMLLEGNTASFALWFFLGIGSLIAADVARRQPGETSTTTMPAMPASAEAP
ncbi:MAG: O-antigen ligase family protein [Chloroflexota bacterium]|nr:O-antigen ligase family protein [Chloroflexota bacterium]